jgi:hypothetical protein
MGFDFFAEHQRIAYNPDKVWGWLCGRFSQILKSHACDLGLEGILSKRICSRYVSGCTRAWLKMKNPTFERR